MRSILLVIMTTIALQLSAQPRVGFAYYDVDRAYDTTPSAFYDDSDFTPKGRNLWDRERYTRKVEQIAATIDSMALPIVALYGVENEQVVRDIATHTKGDYTFIHRTLNRLDGMDFALLYYGDVLFPEKVESGFDYMVVKASVGNRDFAFILTHRSRLTEDIVLQLQRTRATSPYCRCRRPLWHRLCTAWPDRCHRRCRACRTRQHVLSQSLAYVRPHIDRHTPCNTLRCLCPQVAARPQRRAKIDLQPRGLCGWSGQKITNILLYVVKIVVFEQKIRIFVVAL